MPSAPAGAAAPSASPLPPGPGPAVQLAQASRALWMATLSLMTAFMQTAAPAHRYLLARRIARNFQTLAGQECFDTGSRASFGRLAARWASKSEQLAPGRAQPQGLRGFLRFLF